MSGRASQLVLGGVSRRALSLNPYTWFATWSMMAGLGGLTLVIGLVGDSFDTDRMLPYGGVMFVAALVFKLMHPPAIGTWANHGVLAWVSLTAVGGIYTYQPGGSPAFAAAMFIGPLIAVRLIDRRQIVAQLSLATAGFAVLPLVAVDTATLLSFLTIIPAMWVLCACCVVILEGAEQQGDELEQLVRRDPLTGVGNRRLLADRLPSELHRHAHIHQPLTVITLDLNGFKALNDTLGHAAGDDLLRSVADVLVHASGEEAIVVRQGGDEFCVILLQCSAAQASQTADDIREGLAAVAARGLPVTTGIGIASFPEDATDADELLHIADERLRMNKGTLAAERRRSGAGPIDEPLARALDRDVAGAP